MSLSDLAALVSVVSGLAVLASLVYLAQQTRQNSQHTRALIQQGRVARSSDQILRFAMPELAPVYLKGLAGSTDMSELELFQFQGMFVAMLRSVEDTYFQFDLKLLDEQSLQNQLTSFRSTINARGGLALWTVLRDAFDPQLVRRVDQLVEARSAPRETPINPMQSRWRAALAKL